MCRKFCDEVFEGLYKLPTGQAVYCRFHVLYGLTRDKRNTEPLPFSTPIFFYYCYYIIIKQKSLTFEEK